MNAYKIILLIHVAFGFSALATGLVPMFAQKGGKTHNFWGNIYYWGMFGVFITTIALFGIRPTELRLQFFLMIAIFSFYQTFSGVRALRMKKMAKNPALLDNAAAWITLGCGLVMMGYGIWQFSKGNSGMAILFSIFGAGCFVNGFQDVRLFAGKIQEEKMHWFFRHLTRMVGSYTATLTAFLVNMSRFFPESMQMVAWIAPGIVAGVVITRLIKSYRQKFQTSAAKKVSVATAV